MRNFLTKCGALALSLALFCTFFAGCAKSTDTRPTDDPRTYAITFYVDGEEYASVRTAGNEEITLPAEPQKSGAEFVGWYFDQGTWQQPFTAGTYGDAALEKDVSVYARFEETAPPEPQEYAITFYVDGEEYASVRTAGNEEITLPAEPQKSGAEFVGWYFDQGTWQQPFTAGTYGDAALEKDVSVYARFEETAPPEPQEYTITFYAEGELIKEYRTAGGEVVKAPSAPAKTGYEFRGWYFDDGVWEKPYAEDAFADKFLTADVGVYARYEKTAPPEPQKHTITFDTRGGSALSPAEYSVIESSEQLPVPIYSGHVFTGWFLDRDCKTPVTYPYTVEDDLIFYAGWDTENVRLVIDSSGAITGVENALGAFSVEIPEKVDGITVTSIAKGAFSGTGVVSVHIPATVRYIGTAFNGCKDLSEVILEEGVTTIHEGAFENCVSLKTIDFPDSLLEIRADAFENSGLTQVSLNKVRYVQNYVFKNCTALSALDLGEVRELGDSVFEGCTALESVSLPSSLERVGGSVFADCSSLSEVALPENGILLNYNTLYRTKCIADKSNWSNGLIVIDGYVFGVTEALAGARTLSVPEGVLGIAGGAFLPTGGGSGYTTSLETINLPQSLKCVGDGAFQNCSKLVSVSGAENIAAMGADVLAGTAIYENKNGEAWYKGGLYLGNWLIDVDSAVSGNFEVKEGTEYIIDSKERFFPMKALKKITSLTLPSSLRRIGKNAFNNLIEIESVTLPENLESIGENAFMACIKLASINLGECTALREIGDAAFVQCAFTAVTIPAGVQKMGINIFNRNPENLIVYCEVSSKPDGWSNNWDYDLSNERVTVVWGQKQP